MNSNCCSIYFVSLPNVGLPALSGHKMKMIITTRKHYRNEGYLCVSTVVTTFLFCEPLRDGKATFGRNKTKRTAMRILLINEDFDLNVVSDRCRMVLRSCLRLVFVNAVGEKYEERTTLADELVKLLSWRFRETSALGENFLIQHLAHRKRARRTKWCIHQNDTSSRFSAKNLYTKMIHSPKWYIWLEKSFWNTKMIYSF